MNMHRKTYRDNMITTLVLVLGLLMPTLTPTARAQGNPNPNNIQYGTLSAKWLQRPLSIPSSSGQVLPAGGKPKSYSLADAAAATAYFNTGPRTPDTLPGGFPFQTLYVTNELSNTFTVKEDTMLYVPVVYSDDTDSALWPYPDVTSPEAVSAYYFDPAQLGIEFAKIVVDGKVTVLGPQYAVGAVTPGLPSGGNNYTVVGAFLSPLSSGSHTVKISVRASGAFFAMHPDFFPGGVVEVEITYTVLVH
ncbi:MAG TPA: hypothetical protein PLK30_12930 [Blastocatellia bacterium]|nr:hypothetical protein [Blastocatellia bacterium]